MRRPEKSTYCISNFCDIKWHVRKIQSLKKYNPINYLLNFDSLNADFCLKCPK